MKPVLRITGGLLPSQMLVFFQFLCGGLRRFHYVETRHVARWRRNSIEAAVLECGREGVGLWDNNIIVHGPLDAAFPLSRRDENTIRVSDIVVRLAVDLLEIKTFETTKCEVIRSVWECGGTRCWLTGVCGLTLADEAVWRDRLPKMILSRESM